MSHVADALAGTHPDWGSLPSELVTAFDWMEQRRPDAGSGECCIPWDSERQLGIVFRSDLTMAGWLEGNSGDQLLPIAESDGAGGLLALWRAPDGRLPVVLIDDLDKLIIADTVLDFLRLVAIGHDEIKSFTVSTAPSPESAAAHSSFRDWLTDTFDVTVPEEWHAVGDDEFTDWWAAATGDSGPVSTTENADAGAGRITVGGTVGTLLDLLGTDDGPEAAALVGDLIGTDLGSTLRSATRKLRTHGIEVSVERGALATMWLHLGPDRSIGFGIPAQEVPLWTGPELMDGLSADASRAHVRTQFGDPEREGESYLRYRVGEKFLHLGFGETDLLAKVTLMLRVP